MEKNITILIVDDEKDFVLPIAFWFKAKGYTVLTAHNGKDGLQMVKENKPDIIFLDLNMPVMDGPEALKQIRTIDKNVPIIIISAYVDRYRIKDVKPYNISGVFYKGEDFEKGLALLEATLRTHKKLKDKGQ